MKSDEIENAVETEKVEPVVEYQTKSIPVEVASGRVIKFISPEGEEFLVRPGRALRFRKSHGVDDKWTVI